MVRRPRSKDHMARRTSISPAQTNFEQITSFEAGWWQPKGIFSSHYLRQHLLAGDHLPSEESCQSLYEETRRRWTDNYAGLRRQNEAYTRTEFLDVVLRDLGWQFLPEQSLPRGATRKRPDYCLFADEATRQQVAAEGDATAVFRASLSTLEAKKVELALDEVATTETPGWYPSQQVQDYLSHAQDGNGRFFNWAILTNGNEWRLYCDQAAPNDCFVFHLARGAEFCPLDQFRLFVGLFGRDAFAQDPQKRCRLDAIREESLTRQEELETRLRRRIFSVLLELAEGFYRNPRNGLTEGDLTAVYDVSLIFLYRLLFVLYAESRGLLPAKAGGWGAGNRYFNEYSLAQLFDRLRQPPQPENDAFDSLYERLLRLFQVIDGSNEAQNRALNVTRFNGGLFDPARHPEIKRWRVGDQTLADVLKQLVFAQPPATARQQQQVIATGETVDYATLEVRQLGDIYEGLLGGRLRAGNGGRLELVDDDGQNHQSGIFYTPDWIVKYLIQETLSPLMERIAQSGAVRAAGQAQSREGRENNAFALGVLRLNVVDPAMGSGHFLVRATEWLAEQIVYHPTTRLMTEPVVEQGEARRTREQIVASGRVPVPPGTPQEQAEIAYWRRRVVEACIYGVDTNPLAVELAKLSLWLTCIAVDEPLNFLDHHLAEGNSLLFARPDETTRLSVCLTPDEAQQLELDTVDLFQSVVRDTIRATLAIESQASTEMEVVKNKERQWRTVRDQTEPFLSVLDL